MRDPLTLRDCRNILLVLKIALALFGLFSDCYGQPVVRIKQVVQSCDRVRCLRSEAKWSGCVIGTLSNGEQAVLTCAHSIHNRGDLEKPPAVEIRAGVWVNGKWRAWHHERDVALISVPYEAVDYLPLGENDPPAGASVTTYGFPAGGTLAVRSGRVLSLSPLWTTLDTANQPGESGGPFVVDGFVIGTAKGVYSEGPGQNRCVGPSLAMIRSTLLELIREIPGRGEAPSGGQQPTPVDPVPQQPIDPRPRDPPETPPDVAPEPSPEKSVEKSRLGTFFSIAGATFTLAETLGLVGATGGIGAAVMGGIALFRTLRRARQVIHDYRQPSDPYIRGGQQTQPPDGFTKPPPPPAPPSVVTVQSPPSPQVIVPETRFVPVERDTFAEAYDYAKGELVKKFPGSEGTVQTVDSLIAQYLSSKGLARKAS